MTRVQEPPGDRTPRTRKIRATSTTGVSSWAPRSPNQDQAIDWENGTGRAPNQQDWGEGLPEGCIRERLSVSDVRSPERSSTADQGERHKAVSQALKNTIPGVTHADQPV